MDDADSELEPGALQRGQKRSFRMLRMVGYKVEKIPFVPTSGWTGDNLVKPSDKMPWYKGPTFLTL
jgi:elongation factor 1-alpha